MFPHNHFQLAPRIVFTLVEELFPIITFSIPPLLLRPLIYIILCSYINYEKSDLLIKSFCLLASCINSNKMNFSQGFRSDWNMAWQKDSYIQGWCRVHRQRTLSLTIFFRFPPFQPFYLFFLLDPSLRNHEIDLAREKVDTLLILNQNLLSASCLWRSGA